MLCIMLPILHYIRSLQSPTAGNDDVYDIPDNPKVTANDAVYELPQDTLLTK